MASRSGVGGLSASMKELVESLGAVPSSPQDPDGTGAVAAHLLNDVPYRNECKTEGASRGRAHGRATTPCGWISRVWTGLEPR